MSSYVVSENTINSIISYLADNKSEFKICKTEKDCQKLAEKMKEMNVEAVNKRYNTNKVIKKIKYLHLLRTEVQVLKNLDCYLYQCFEVTVPKCKLFKKLSYIQVMIMKNIIINLNIYQTANWGES